MITSTTTQASTMKQLIPSEIWSSLESDDSALMKEVKDTHSPDGRKVEVKPLLRIIDGILLRALSSSSVDMPSDIPEEKGLLLEDKTSLPDSDVKLKAHADIINKVSYELVCCNTCVTAMVNANKPILNPFGVKMVCKCLATGGDVQAKAMALLKILSNYSWDAKVVLVMAAFVANYGDFFLFAPSSYAKISSISQSMALLRQLRDITEYAKLSKTKFHAIVKLVKVVMDITKCIIEFNDLPLEPYEGSQVSIALSYVPKAAYWTILNVVICASEIVALNGFQESPTELSLDLSSWANEGIKIQEILKIQIGLCKQQVDEQITEGYLRLINFVSRRKESNLEFFKTFLSVNGRQQLVDHTNRKISIEELRKKNVSLLISGLDISKEEIDTLEMWYKESQKSAGTQYQVVWLPILDESISWDQEMYQKYEQLRSSMPWYIVAEPSKIRPEVIKYIRKQWNFENKMILVPVDAQGNVQSLNALDMLRIKGFTGAFPFTKENEESILQNQSWTLELLFGVIDQVILDKAKEGKIVCIFGGEDIEWIQEFTREAKNVEQKAGISLELVYVGKSSAMKQVEKIVKTIDADKLGLYKIELKSIRNFWSRLESILYFKMKQGKNFKNDGLMREVMTLLSYDGSDKGWALFCKGSSEMAIAKGDVALKGVKQLNDAGTKEKDFLQALGDYFKQSRTMQYYYRIILTGNRWGIPSKTLSAEGCECALEKCFVYSCCAE